MNGPDGFLALAGVAPTPMWASDADGAWTFANPAWLQLTGQTGRDAAGEGWLGALADADRARVRERLGQCTRAHGPFEADARVRTVAGSLRWFRLAAAPCFAADGTLDRYVGVATDISGAEWHSTYEMTPGRADDVLFEWDAHHDRVSFDAAITHLLGHPVADLTTAAGWMKHVHPDDREALREQSKPRETDSRTYRAEYRFLDVEGHAVPIRVQGAVLRNDAGEAVSVLGLLTDLRREQRKRWWTEAQAAILDNLSECVTVVDDLGQIIYANRAVHTVFGYEPGELVGERVAILAADAASGSTERVRAQHDAASRSGHWEGEFQNRRKDGSTFRMRAIVAPFVHEGRRWWITVRRDVTELRHLETAVLETSHRERHRIATELHERLGQVLAGLGLSLAGLRRELERTQPRSAAKLGSALDAVHEAIAHCRACAEDLTLSTLGREGLLNGLQHAALRAELQFGLPCHVDLDATAAHVVPASAATELCRIVQEALVNAGRHAGAQALWLSLRYREDAAEICIADDGRGFDPDAIEPHGFGLKLMRYRASQIGAQLDVNSSAGSGTRVYCRLSPSVA
jgi:PAS domain S-box-containing protein